MSTPVKIIGPFATPEDTAKALGVPAEQRKQLEKLVDDLLSDRSRRSTRSATTRKVAVSPKAKRTSISNKNSLNGNRKRQRASG